MRPSCNGQLSCRRSRPQGRRWMSRGNAHDRAVVDRYHRARSEQTQAEVAGLEASLEMLRQETKAKMSKLGAVAAVQTAIRAHRRDTEGQADPGVQAASNEGADDADKAKRR
eukprot:TRINITY_DN10844_c0_g1_i11.p3 TRINITY_DN10844_c0_g1~~TRINITY_DN10844_c0_g1_i11.p3  ORF type:complete len:112 (+),score=4.19 TRINITY_DN10844_c0_g1_i11:825-1160(+)